MCCASIESVFGLKSVHILDASSQSHLHQPDLGQPPSRMNLEVSILLVPTEPTSRHIIMQLQEAMVYAL